MVFVSGEGALKVMGVGGKGVLIGQCGGWLAGGRRRLCDVMYMIGRLSAGHGHGVDDLLQFAA